MRTVARERESMSKMTSEVPQVIKVITALDGVQLECEGRALSHLPLH